jgi:hypothetical protein
MKIYKYTEKENSKQGYIYLAISFGFLFVGIVLNMGYWFHTFSVVMFILAGYKLFWVKRIFKNYKEQIKKHNLSCSECKEHYKDHLDQFVCNYCKLHHCTKHRLPEDHDCIGSPKSPSKGFRELHSKDKIKAYGK